MIFQRTQNTSVVCHDGGHGIIVLRLCHSVTIQLDSQVSEHLNQLIVFCCLKDHIMEIFVNIHKTLYIIFRNRAFKIHFHIFQLLQTFLCHLLTSQRGCKPFQRASDFQNIYDILFCHIQHLRALSGHQLYQIFQLQHTQCLSDRSTAYAKLFRQLIFHQSFSGNQLACQNRIPQCVKYDISQR